jgi:hypothetical protein
MGGGESPNTASSTYTFRAKEFEAKSEKETELEGHLLFAVPWTTPPEQLLDKIRNQFPKLKVSWIDPSKEDVSDGMFFPRWLAYLSFVYFIFIFFKPLFFCSLPLLFFSLVSP